MVNLDKFAEDALDTTILRVDASMRHVLTSDTISNILKAEKGLAPKYREAITKRLGLFLQERLNAAVTPEDVWAYSNLVRAFSDLHDIRINEIPINRQPYDSFYDMDFPMPEIDEVVADIISLEQIVNNMSKNYCGQKKFEVDEELLFRLIQIRCPTLNIENINLCTSFCPMEAYAKQTWNKKTGITQKEEVGISAVLTFFSNSPRYVEVLSHEYVHLDGMHSGARTVLDSFKVMEGYGAHKNDARILVYIGAGLRIPAMLTYVHKRRMKLRGGFCNNNLQNEILGEFISMGVDSKLAKKIIQDYYENVIDGNIKFGSVDGFLDENIDFYCFAKTKGEISRFIKNNG